MNPAETDDRLQQYFDGELPPEEAAELEQMLGADDSLRARREGLEHISHLVSSSIRPCAEADLDSKALWEGIQSRLGGAFDDHDDPFFPQSEADPALRVIEGGAKPVPPAKPANPRRTQPARRWWPAASVAALAAAAAVLLFVLRSDPPSIEEEVTRGSTPTGSMVEEVDFGYNTGAVFNVHGQTGTQYAVLWISDEKITPSGESQAPTDGTERLQ